jgi:alkanesulfonate monooxygenase SsuD/methylene tetrahydromethanopterin reductase-like flavin-dependent oxidoreductase (luciferase family)
MQVEYHTRGKRFVESLELLRLAWTGEPFTFTGEIFQLPEVVVRPTPIQRPGIPLWLGGTTEVAMRRVVRHGAPVFPGATDELGVVAKRMASYDRLRDELGPPAHQGPSAPRELILPRLAVVADTTEEARRRALPGIRAMLETYQSWGLPVDFTQMLRDWELLDDLVIVGDADHCRDCVERYAQLGLTDLLLQFAMPAVDPGIIAESQARFMAEVATPSAEVHV